LLALAWLPANWIELGYRLLDQLADALMAYLQFIQDVGLQAVDFSPHSNWQPAMGLLLLVLLLLPRPLMPMRVWLLLLPGILLWPRDNTNNTPLQVAVLDVGMGNAVVVQTRHHSLIYDFGPGNRSGFSLGRWAVEPYLREQGIDEIDRIVISHADQDHAGGLHALSNKYSRVPVLCGTPSQLRKRFAPLRSISDCHRVTPWWWDGVEFRFLPLPPGMPDNDNNRSCVLRISVGDERLLLTGDIEASREQQLLEQQQPAALRAEILLAPHHGSRTSSSTAFIDAVRPEHVIFSVGHLNRWSFPQREVLERYQSAAVRIHRTDRDGAIQISCDEDDCRVEQFRRRYPRIWY
jgi:competence protein ComEC